MKKIILVLSMILILVGVAYFIFSDNEDGVGEGMSEFFPIGAIKDIFNAPENNLSISNESTGDTLPSLIKKVAENPIAGFGIINLNGNSSIIYVDKNTGHIYVYDLNQDESEVIRVSNITIAGAIDSTLGQDAKNLYAFIKNQTGRISLIKIPLSDLLSGESASQSSLNMVSLPTISPDGNKMFFLEKFNDGILGVIANLDLTGRQMVWESAILNWQARWVDGQTIALQQPSSYYLSRNLYLLNTTTKSITKILANQRGLTSLVSPDKKYVFYSQSTGDNLENFIKNIETNEIYPTQTKTLSDKCSWSDDSYLIYCGISDQVYTGLYPDEWYQGKINYPNDNLFYITPNPPGVGTPILINKDFDIDQIKIIDNYNILVSNKKDSSLWILELID